MADCPAVLPAAYMVKCGWNNLDGKFPDLWSRITICLTRTVCGIADAWKEDTIKRGKPEWGMYVQVNRNHWMTRQKKRSFISCYNQSEVTLVVVSLRVDRYHLTGYESYIYIYIYIGGLSRGNFWLWNVIGRLETRSVMTSRYLVHVQRFLWLVECGHHQCI